MSNIFETGKYLDPEYQFLDKYVLIMYRGFWTPAKYEKLIKEQDVPYYFNNMNEIDREAIKRCILAIALVEDKVKAYWPSLFFDLPQTVIGDIGSVFGMSECFDSETEILTESGFVKFPLLKNTDKVAQYNLDTEEISFVSPVSYINRPYSGVMHHYKSKSLDLMVTPNHEIIVKHPSSYKIKKAKSSEGLWKRNYLYPRAGFLNKGQITKLSPRERLLIAIQADGSLFGTCPTGSGRKDFVFLLKKSRKVDRLISILKDCGLEYNIRTRKSAKYGDFTAISAKIWDDFDVRLIKSFGWVDLTKLTSSWISDFFEELSNWDSSIREHSFTYYNSNEEAVDKICAIGALGGYVVNKGINRQKGVKLNPSLPSIKDTIEKTCYALSVTKNTWGVYPDRKEVQYNGNVYCVEVPSGCVVVRRGKRVSISGNCTHRRSYHSLLENLRIDPKEIHDHPATKGRIDYLSKYLETDPKIIGKKRVLKKLVLFTSLVERVSLFTQFYILMSYARANRGLETIAALQQTTATEEVVHYSCGIDIINKIKEESPQIWDEYLVELIEKNIKSAYRAEENLINWFFEKGVPEHLTKKEVFNFLNYNMNTVCRDLGLGVSFDYDKKLYEDKNKWFMEKISTAGEPDFFAAPVGGYASEDVDIDLDNFNF